MRRFAARWAFPTGSAPLGPATVTVEAGRVTAIQPGVANDAADWAGYAIAPPFVNAHCHLDLSGAAGACPVDPAVPFPDWLASVIAFRRARPGDAVARDIDAGIGELVAAGTGLVGDIAGGPASFDALRADGRLAGVSFRELIGLSPARAAAALDGARAWLCGVDSGGRVRPGLSPHAPYSAGRALLSGAGALAAGAGVAVTLHLAESPEELELLAAGSGPFVPFLQAVGAWGGAEFAADFAAAASPLAAAPRLLLAHGNLLAACDVPAGAAVAYCPRTHAAFGHSRHPVAELLAAGVRVCLGTDGRASNPDLDVLAEARWLYANRPDLPGATLLSMLTEWGAAALGFADAGRLAVGRAADFVGVPVDPREPDPYRALFATGGGARRTVGGAGRTW